MIKKILIADDEEDIIKVVECRLGAAGYEVLIAVNGKEAVDKAVEFKPNLIILEYSMSILSGEQVCRVLKSNKAFKHIPIIMMTANISNTTVEEIRRMGADDSLLKPFESLELMRKVRLWTD